MCSRFLGSGVLGSPVVDARKRFVKKASAFVCLFDCLFCSFVCLYCFVVFSDLFFSFVLCVHVYYLC